MPPVQLTAYKQALAGNMTSRVLLMHGIETDLLTEFANKKENDTTVFLYVKIFSQNII